MHIFLAGKRLVLKLNYHFLRHCLQKVSWWQTHYRIKWRMECLYCDNDCKSFLFPNAIKSFLFLNKVPWKRELRWCLTCLKCMCVWIDGWMDGWIDEWMDGRTDKQMDGWMDGYVCVCVRRYVCIYIHMYVRRNVRTNVSLYVYMNNRVMICFI